MALLRIFLCPFFIILFTGSLRVHGLQERARIPNRRWYSSSPTVIRGDQPPLPDPDELTSKPINRRPLIATINSTSQHPLSTKLMSSYTTQSRGYTPTMLHPCEQSSCYPATGNLLIGRESRLHASSTCGLNGQERYCIVSHLEDRKKCFWCHTNQHTENNPHLNHAIKNIVYRNHPGTRTRSWWQSENGKENVTIQLDMEAEFHFTHLIIVFKTFRPAAMLIERSYDFGKTWQVYRYFAHNCEESFPGVPKHVFRALTDVVCESRYSNVAPSSEGEIIFRVLPPTLQIDDPYSLQVQNLLKMTNLRINFTKLHTLGDDLLDNRDEIQEKYYYAISDMVVRGSCSCYGHASRCLPLPGVVAKTDMVHGRCECTHNTKGLNCEVCEDFFNDLPWKPAINKQTNACRRCSCNNHATSCHFDPAVFESTGRISGGVCDGCQHNTMGRNCEQCKQFFYQDPEVDIQSAEVCKPCDCDPRGSLDNGICDSVTDIVNNLEAGRCTCKRNVDGRRCDNCKIGFWNFEEDNPEGCETCTCNTFGTVDNQGCNLYTGECTCKRYVTGRDCNQCLPEHWGLSDDRDGCQACDCDLGGSLDNHCDVITGQCKCREHVQGRTCSTPIQHFYIGSLDALTYEAELAKCTDNCQIVIREPYRDGRNNTWTGPGFMRSFENSEIEFTIDDIYTTMEYDIVVRYEPQDNNGTTPTITNLILLQPLSSNYCFQLPGEWEDVTLVVERQSPVDPNSACWNSIPKDDSKRAALSHTSRNSKVFPPACLEARKTYKVKLHFNRHNSLVDNPSASILIDSIVLVPKIDAIPFFVESSPQAENMREEYERNRCSQSYYDVQKSQTPEVCKKYRNSIGFYVFNGAFSCQCDPTGSISKICSEYSGTCQCKPNVVGRRCDRCAPGTYGFGPDGCKACDCNSIGSLDNFCEDLTGQCKCRPNTYGRECDQCQPGFWNFPNCQRCECNGHADICQPKTGACIECRDYTVGQRCEICVEGHYGNPILGRDIPCRPCPCPGTVDSGHSYADRCNLDPYTEDVVCECQNGYAGSRCDVCADNYYGHPDVPGGRCFPCDCNNNTHISLPGNCDPQTGRCIKCQFNTEGDHCGICKAGYYGDATQKLCTECVCNVLGTDGNIIHCDRQTGQCPCLRNVIGLECDQCRKNYWKIASGEGCEACDCDPIGSEAEQCNEFDGQCVCKPGFGGRQCDQCQTNHWGNPNIECHACKCDRTGSLTLQCHRENGTCICDTGIGGDKCDKCARGYLGHAPQCAACGECFENWDAVLIGLQGQTNRIIEDASKIKTKGATGAYAREFDIMEKELGDVKDVLANTEVSTNDVDDLEDYVSTLRQNLNISTHSLQDVENGLESTGQEIKLAKVALEDLRDKGSNLRALAGELKGNATKLQEANVEGALNLTQDAKQRALLAEDNALRTQDITAEAERNCKRTEGLINRAAENYNELTQENENDLKTLQNKLRDLEKAMPLLNKKVCDKEGDPCDSLCGGAGCGVCGGLSCEEGSVNKAEKALEFAKATDKKIKDHEAELDSLLRSMSQAKQDTIDAYQKALEAYNIAINARNTSDALIKSGSDVVKELNENLIGNHSTPSEVRALATETLAMNIQLKPEQIENLGQKITETVDQLTDINKIIQETAEDLANVNELKTQAHEAKEQAENILNKTTKVVAALNDAENAQKEASSAIVQANNDIDAARRDLTEIGRETVGAQEKASETAKKVNELQTRLRTVQNNFYGNDHESKVVKAEAEALITQTEQALTTASDLRNKYREADLSLTEKVKQSANAREKARTLLDRANKLSVETTDKLTKLKGMEEAYNNNTQSFLDLNGIIDSLMKKMENYLSGINQKSEYYRTCT